ncbi:MAG TPA: hypothetical protein VNU97_12535 [Rhizomicrobium sp.]|nr:hypothetical protein [Rhizomicrobium sp.]
MRKQLIAVMAAAALLGGCQTIAALSSGHGLVQGPALVDAEKALAVAHLAYQAAGVSMQAAAQSGALHGVDAASAKALFDRAGALLDTADQADALANAQGVLDAVAGADALLVQIKTLTAK